MVPEPRRSTVVVARHPLYAMLAPVPIICFVGTFLTDIVYWQTAEMMWANFSAWLVTIGVVMGVLAGIVGILDFVLNRRFRTLPPSWPYVIGTAAALLLSVINALVHSRDAWTSVVPTGLILSTIVVIILILTGWMGWSVAYRRVGVTDIGVAE